MRGKYINDEWVPNPKGTWISVEDGTPCFGEEVTGKFEDGSKEIVTVNNFESGQYWSIPSPKVTHWRPLDR